MTQVNFTADEYNAYIGRRLAQFPTYRPIRPPVGMTEREAMVKYGRIVVIPERKWTLGQRIRGAAAALWGFAQDKLALVPKAVEEERRRICQACPNYGNEAQPCKICGCRALKLDLIRERCPLPIPRWTAYRPRYTWIVRIVVDPLDAPTSIRTVISVAEAGWTEFTLYGSSQVDGLDFEVEALPSEPWPTVEPYPDFTMVIETPQILPGDLRYRVEQFLDPNEPRMIEMDHGTIWPGRPLNVPHKHDSWHFGS